MKVLKDSVVYITGEILAKSVPFLLIPYLSRKLGVEGYGELSYYQTYIALFVIFVGLSQEGAIARYFYFYGKLSLNLIMNAGYIYSIIVGCIILSICVVIKSEILSYVSLIAILKTFVNVQLSVRQCKKQTFKYTLIQLSTVITSALLTILMLEYYKEDLVEKRILALVFSNFIVFGFSYFLYKRDIKIKKVYSFRNYKTALLYIIGFGFPLLFHNASFFVKGQVDRIFIYNKFTKYDLGLYSMGANIALVLSVLILAVNKATIPYYYEKLKRKDLTLKQIHKWFFYSFLIVPIPSLIFWLIPESLILWIIGEEFQGVKYYASILMIAMALIIPYLLLVNYLFYHSKNKEIAFCSILSSGVYLLALFLLVYTDMIYVPYASVIASLSILPILFYITKKVKD